MKDETARKAVASTRALGIFEFLCRFGPATLSEVVANVGGTKTTVWRSLGHLVQLGWVHPRIIDRKYLVANHVDRLMALAQVALPEQESVVVAMRALARSRVFDGRIGILTSFNRFMILDGNSGFSQEHISGFTTDTIGFVAAISNRTKQEVSEAIGLMLESLPPSHRSETEEEVRYLLSSIFQGKVCAPYDNSIGVAIRFSTGSSGAIVLSVKASSTIRWPRALSEAVKCLQDIESNSRGLLKVELPAASK